MVCLMIGNMPMYNSASPLAAWVCNPFLDKFTMDTMAHTEICSTVSHCCARAGYIRLLLSVITFPAAKVM